MRWSQSMISTLREDPQEAEIPSHKLMLRAGLIRRLAGGLYTFLPLGLRALRKVEAVIRDEMDSAGALEILMPALQPREVWEQSGRYNAMGDVMFKVTDRQKREMVLGPTHEEIVTQLAAREINSYRQVPKTFYQIQTKFRDEIRPRFGLMRAKEFIMKDAYSFDLGWDEADASYQAMYDAYIRIFKRCGLRTKIVEADTGAMGGKWSHEFMVLADSGEDGLVECETCSYAANLERAERMFGAVPKFPDSDKPLEEVATPGMRTIAQISEFFGCEPQQLIKTLIYIVDSKPVAVLVPGDREVNEHKLMRALEAKDAVLADDATTQAASGAPVGFAGPVGLAIPVYADSSLKGYAGAITGANKNDTHLINVSIKRDTTITGYFDLCIVREGDGCPRCGKAMQEKRGIEVGHVFKLGTKYSESFDASYLNENGQKQPLVMGCYGIGVTRTLQSIIEQRHDDNGIDWPIAVAPYHVAILMLDPEDAETREKSETLSDELQKRGIEVLLDDRDERPGVKFKDADLIGLPIRIVIGKRGLSKGQVEIKMRKDNGPEFIACDAALDKIVELINKCL